MALMTLGTCEKCHGDLCVSGRMVCCDRCGHQVPDHPALKETGIAPPTPFAIKHSDNPASWIERIMALELKVAEQGKAIAESRAKLASLRK